MAKGFNMKINYIVGITMLVFAVVIAAIFGSADISISDFFKVIVNGIPGLDGSYEVPKSHMIIIYNLRLPRITMALFAGVGLSLAGCVFQGVFSNPMAEPYLLGVSSGAAFGATVAAVFEIQAKFLSFTAVSLFAFIGAIMVVTVIYRMAVVKGTLPVAVLLLSGLAVNYFLSSLITLMMTFNQEKLESVYFWTLGSFKSATWERVILVGVVVLICSIVIYKYSRELDMIMLGDEQAKSLGIEVDILKKKNCS